MNIIALLATAIPPIIFAVTSVVLAIVLNPQTEGLNIVDNFLQVSIGLLVIAFIAMIVLFAIRQRKDIAWGIFAGSAIGFLVWVGSFIAISLIGEFLLN
jgi:hypothetical protein